MSRKLTKEEFIKRAIEKHGDKYDYSKVDYNSNKEKVCIICKEDGHGEFYQSPSDHFKGRGCPKCSGKIKLTKSEFVERAKKVHGEKYDYSKVSYKNNSTKVCIICKESEHGEFYQRPVDHIKGNGCPKCSGNAKLTTVEFVLRARGVHGDKYDYSKVSYKNNSTKVCIICKESEHGEFYQTPDCHLIGNGCPKCSNNVKLTTKKFIERSREVHGDKYDYSKVKYKDSSTKVCIICKESEHGEFYQVANTHLRGSGCPKCKGGVRLTTGKFIDKAKSMHGDKYDYSEVEYKSSSTAIKIFCKIHGYFNQIPAAHLQGRGCPKCGVGFSSDSKLSLLSDSDIEHLSVHQLIELIGQNLLPADFKVLTKTASGSKDRKDDI